MLWTVTNAPTYVCLLQSTWLPVAGMQTNGVSSVQRSVKYAHPNATSMRQSIANAVQKSAEGVRKNAVKCRELQLNTSKAAAESAALSKLF